MHMYAQQNFPLHVRRLEWWLTQNHDRQTFFYPPDAVAIHALLMFMLLAGISCGHALSVHGCAAQADSPFGQLPNCPSWRNFWVT